MTDKQIIDALLKQLNGNEDSEYVTIPKEIVVAVVRMLSGQKRIGDGLADAKGSVLFYCADCGKSFRADGREDEECFRKYRYHTWYASC
ncbi:MAG: hypothetical protein IJQ88_04525, partial [Clostridia bacterium]|nr:hypothetical protein [Clostridia bacterium]